MIFTRGACAIAGGWFSRFASGAAEEDVEVGVGGGDGGGKGGCRGGGIWATALLRRGGRRSAVLHPVGAMS